MASEKLTKWANSGTKTAPTGSKINTGWINDEQVPYEWLNWLQDRVEEKVNEVLEERLNSFYDDATDWKNMIAAGVWDDSWALTNETANVISTGSTKKIIDLATYIDANGDARLMLLDQANTKLEIWNPRTLASIIISDDLSNDLPTGGGQTWEAYSFCTDGTNVYAMFRDTNASPNTHIVQAWVIDEASSNWSVVTGWPATGYALSGTGNGLLSQFPDGRVIIANDTDIAVLCGWAVVSSSASPAIYMIKKDYSAVSFGAGDCPTGISTQPTGRPCSDGTYIYFSTYKSGQNSYVCSATIATPASGCGGTNYPLDLGSALHGRNLVSCGPNMVISALTDDGPGAASFVMFRSHSSADADLDILVLGQDAQATPITGEKTHLYATFDLCFDGINMWVFGAVDNTSASIGNFVLTSMDAAQMSITDTNVTRQMVDVLKPACYVDPDTLWAGGYTYGHCTLVFDGRDLWVNPEPRASQTNSGKIFRLPLALLRG